MASQLEVWRQRGSQVAASRMWKMTDFVLTSLKYHATRYSLPVLFFFFFWGLVCCYSYNNWLVRKKAVSFQSHRYKGSYFLSRRGDLEKEIPSSPDTVFSLIQAPPNYRPRLFFNLNWLIILRKFWIIQGKFNKFWFLNHKTRKSCCFFLWIDALKPLYHTICTLFWSKLGKYYLEGGVN